MNKTKMVKYKYVAIKGFNINNEYHKDFVMAIKDKFSILILHDDKNVKEMVSYFGDDSLEFLGWTVMPKTNNTGKFNILMRVILV